MCAVYCLSFRYKPTLFSILSITCEISMLPSKIPLYLLAQQKPQELPRSLLIGGISVDGKRNVLQTCRMAAIVKKPFHSNVCLCHTIIYQRRQQSQQCSYNLYLVIQVQPIGMIPLYVCQSYFLIYWIVPGIC